MRFLIFLLFPLLLVGEIYAGNVKNREIEVQGHRGCRGVLPENTLPAFAAAIEAGVDVLELDCLLTSDGHVVIYHDFHIDPKLVCYANGAKAPAALIHSLTLAEIKKLDCGKSNPLFPKQRAVLGTALPTLQELFTLIKTSNSPYAQTIRLNLEIKRDSLHPDYTASPALMAKTIINLVRKNNLQERVYYSSFDFESLQAVRKIDPQASIAFLKEGNLNFMVETATLLQTQIVSPEHILISNAEYVHALKALGFKVIVWTVNEQKRWQELIHMGVDGIITDFPQELMRYLELNR
jgi:glycerophosphoryl diester phosphodiesterase